MDSNLDTLDLSGKKLKKLNKPQPHETHVSTLILDDNELQRLDNIDSFSKVQKLSVVRNQLLRMYGVCRLHQLHTLNLAHNGILTIEGVKELVGLKHLCLTGNNIKTIEHLNTNANLDHLDLSENSISHISDLSFLKNLKELLLHGNRIGHLRQCDRYLPTSLTTLTLASNNISDLNEMSQLVHLTNLTNFSITNNPCVNMSGNNVGFDYRPFIINWCMNVKVIDGYVVDAIESLRAEWLYSQGRGRHYRIGDHRELTLYLASVCPMSGEALETEEDRKLRLILSKAQHHQQQLRDQLSTNGVVDSTTPSPATKRRQNSSKNSPRMNSSRLRDRNKSPDPMTTSCYSASGNPDNSSIMTQSLDPKILSQSVAAKLSFGHAEDLKEANEPKENCLDVEAASPLKAATKLLPVPESLMSPDYRPSNSLANRIGLPQTILPIQKQITRKETQTGSPKLARVTHIGRPRSAAETKSNSSPLRARKKISATNIEAPQNSIVKPAQSSDDESEICTSKLQMIKNIANERREKKVVEISNGNGAVNDVKSENTAAIYIQKMWRGYHTRNRNKKALEILKTIQTHRTEEHIQKLALDMESTKAVLESERKIQMLQMQAINALWRKVSSIHPQPNENNTNSTPPVESAEFVKDLAQNFNNLNVQVQQLQNSMQDIMKSMSMFCQMPNAVQHKDIGIATQTEISAVHTPQGEAGKSFPFIKTLRPSSLPLPISKCTKQSSTQSEAPHEVKQFAGSLVEGVIKRVSEISGDSESPENAEAQTDTETAETQADAPLPEQSDD